MELNGILLSTSVVSSQNGTLVQEDYTEVSIAKLLNT